MKQVEWIKEQGSSSELRQFCEGTMDVELIEACYRVFDSDNGLEWLVVLEMWWNNQVLIAFFGWLFSIYAFILSFVFLIDIEAVP